MRSLFFIGSLFFICMAEANRYVVAVEYGEKSNRYQLNLDENSGILSKDGFRKNVNLDKKNTNFLKKDIENILKLSTHDKSFCPRRFISVQDQTKNETRWACIGSKTKIAESSMLLVNTVDTAFKLMR